MLGSPAREDKCRKCQGDGSSCKTVTGLLDMNNLQVGYNDILLIPQGATNILIQERSPSNNYLAIRNLTGHYYLNGNYRIDFPRPMTFAGSLWTYERKPNGFAAPDKITCLGPIVEAVYLVVCNINELNCETFSHEHFLSLPCLSNLSSSAIVTRSKRWS